MCSVQHVTTVSTQVRLYIGSVTVEIDKRHQNPRKLCTYWIVTSQESKSSEGRLGGRRTASSPHQANVTQLQLLFKGPVLLSLIESIKKGSWSPCCRYGELTLSSLSDIGILGNS